MESLEEVLKEKEAELAKKDAKMNEMKGKTMKKMLKLKILM